MPLTKSNHASQTSKQEEFQKIYLLTQPVFDKVKHEIDNEEYLLSLDKEMKKIIYNKNLPTYRKWLEYREILAKYFNLKHFLKESQSIDDTKSTQLLQKMEERVKSLEKLIQSNNLTEAMTSIHNSSEPMDVASESKPDNNENITPNTSQNVLNDTIPQKTNKRRSTTPIEEFESRNHGRRLDFAGPSTDLNDSIQPLNDSQYHDISMWTAPAGQEEVFGETSGRSDESVEFMGEGPMDVSIAPSVIRQTYPTLSLDDSSDVLKRFDDKLISGNSIRRRLEAAPQSVREKFQHKLTTNIFKLVYFDEDQNENLETSVNGLDVAIVENNTVKVYTRSGIDRIKNVKEDSINALRKFLIDFHNEIDDAMDIYNNQQGNYIGTRPYSIMKNDDDSKLFKFKNTGVIIPNELVEQLEGLLNETELTEQEFKDIVFEMVKTYENINRPKILSSRAHATRLNASTPASKKKRKAAELTYGEQTMRTFKEPTKKKPKEKDSAQKGSGFRWIKI